MLRKLRLRTLPGLIFDLWQRLSSVHLHSLQHREASNGSDKSNELIYIGRAERLKDLLQGRKSRVFRTDSKKEISNRTITGGFC